ncbi:hypothetical protein ABZ250_34920 [Streptomyces afghaniensis]|uniref:hypothetical protein n=1 Tax=Streptomyces afghaniensis TaxID=66865 RepID=UPI00339EE93F
MANLLSDGRASTSRFDEQAKGLAAWLRARVLPAPQRLLATPCPVLRASVT